jgi:type IV pilus assembly protein PilC
VPTTFEYKVRDTEGKLRSGTLEADNVSLVADRLRSMGFVPVHIAEVAGANFKKDVALPGFGAKVKVTDIAMFSRQFATMINSGLPLVRSLGILCEQTENKVLAEALRQVRLDVERGSSLAQAVSRHPKVFNRLYVAMVRAGEAGGVLDRVLMQLADSLEKNVQLRRKVKSALSYPTAVLGLVAIVMVAMLLFVVPTFKGLFTSLGGSLPLPTQILVTASEVFQSYFPFIFVGLIVFIFAFLKWSKTNGGRHKVDRFKLAIPLIGPLQHKAAIARFARTLGVLLRAGVSILGALEITAETVGNLVIADALGDVTQSVKVGESMASALERHAVFPPILTQMLMVGEETGTVDEMLTKVAEFYESAVEATVDSLTSILEPVMMMVLGGSVGSMVVALYMPMFEIIKLVK